MLIQTPNAESAITDIYAEEHAGHGGMKTPSTTWTLPHRNAQGYIAELKKFTILH